MLRLCLFEIFLLLKKQKLRRTSPRISTRNFSYANRCAEYKKTDLMSKITYLLLLIITLIGLSCSSTNDFGQRRIGFHYEKIKPNSDPKAYSIIDTSKVYRYLKIQSTITPNNDSIMNENLRANPTYLKFYENGRVGEFRNADLNNIHDFNPQKAESHLYRLKKDKFIIQNYFKHPQCGECFTRGTLKKISNDTIVIISEDYIRTYIKKDIPKSYLKYIPDW